MNVFCWLGWKQPSSVTRAGVELGAVAEPRPRAQPELPARGLPPERAEADDHADAREQRELRGEPRGARVALGGQRLVGRRRAADRGGDPAVAQREPVAAVGGRRLVREPGPVQGGEEEVAAAVAGEHPARAVRAVRGRGEPEQQHAGLRVAEAVDRPAPVLLVAERGALLARDLLAPGDEPRAAAARVDLGRERVEAHAGVAAAACSSPATSRSTTGSSSRTSSGSPVRIWREASSITAPTIAKASCGEASRGTP